MLEYASVVWNPWLLQDISVIENVQRRFTRNVCIICHLPAVSYDERLTLFNLDRLELRRLRTDFVKMFKIVHGYTNVMFLIVCLFHVTMFIMVPEVTVLNSISNVVTKICLNIISQTVLCMHGILYLTAV